MRSNRQNTHLLSDNQRKSEEITLGLSVRKQKDYIHQTKGVINIPMKPEYYCGTHANSKK